MTNEEIREKVLDSYHRLYATYGVQPNRLLVSRDVYNQIKLMPTTAAECTGDIDRSMMLIIQGLKTIIVDGKERIETAILYER